MSGECETCGTYVANPLADDIKGILQQESGFKVGLGLLKPYNDNVNEARNRANLF